ncbi:MAG: hypothetical protein ABH878_00555, partial [bacterium]
MISETEAWLRLTQIEEISYQDLWMIYRALHQAGWTVSDVFEAKPDMLARCHEKLSALIEKVDNHVIDKAARRAKQLKALNAELVFISSLNLDLPEIEDLSPVLAAWGNIRLLKTEDLC